MSSPFVGEIRMWGLNFAPAQWALCNGQLLSISQNTALFSILGTNFGGNGVSTFGLPDFRGNAPIHQGAAPGLSPYDIGEIGGTANVTLNSSNIPVHNHNIMGQNTRVGSLDGPTASTGLARSAGGNTYATQNSSLVNMSTSALSVYSGGNQPHNNMQPYLVVNFCIAIAGIFPSR